jgi:DNA (cytosine-5)-methyltransferase 1/tRNA (cytosine38-C5)-methyltransferase
VVRAIDHDEAAHDTYTAHFGPHALRRNLDSVKDRDLAGADAWWMSPPCQPYTVRGKGRDLDDPRAKSLVHLMDRLSVLRPEVFAMENVPGFPGSRAHALVRRTLREAGYQVAEVLRCPAELGVPMRRPRFYLLARRDRAVVVPPAEVRPRRLADHLDADPDPELWADEELQRRYAGKLALVDPADADAVAHVFTGAYGVSPVYSGSWVHTEAGPRRFSVAEVLRLMGFPEGFALATDKPKKAYKLVGNSLSVDAVASLLPALR